MSYEEFLASKSPRAESAGIEPAAALSAMLFPWQQEIVRWALRRGRAALFCDTGTGKTRMQLEWSRHIAAHVGRPVLILAPLAVSRQTQREGAVIGLEVTICRSQADVRSGVNITNYEMLEHFHLAAFSGVVLDESSILKSYMGKTKQALIDGFSATPYRLACTATPAPNDHMEIGNHAEFLGIMPSSEMLSRWFINDTMQMGHYRLKGHAVEAFWDWVASWAVSLRTPSDIGYSDEGFTLPPLEMVQISVPVDISTQTGDKLFRVADVSATTLHKEMRITAPARVEACRKIVEASWENPVPSIGEDTMPNIKSNDAKTSVTPISDMPQSDKQQTGDGGRRKTQKRSAQPTTSTTCELSSSTSSEPQSSNSADMAWTKTLSSECSPHREDAVPSAAASQREIGDSISIMTTPQDTSEEYSAIPATCLLEESKQTPPSSRGRTPTLSQPISKEPWVLWCNTNMEQDLLEEAFGGNAFSVYGSLSIEEKEARIAAWLDGKRPVLISKPSICGFGLNFQHCHNTAFVGLSYSFEQLYQAVRRVYRFGQRHPVRAYLVVAETEGDILATIRKKMMDHERLFAGMNASTRKTQLARDLALGDYRPSLPLHLPAWLQEYRT